MTELTSCQATLIAAPSSGQGKTMFCAAFARQLRNKGQRVQVFKLGPDYLDPTIHEVASGKVVYNLDLWVMGEQHCLDLLTKASANNDVILVESVMGLHDNLPSNAILCQLFGLPITLILDVAKFAQTAAAIVSGMRLFGAGANITAVIGNKVGSDNHDLLMSHAIGDCYAGSIRRDARFEIAQRHLGLVQAGDIKNLDKQLDQAADALDEFNIFVPLTDIAFSSSNAFFKKSDNARLLDGKIIAIARDAAFSFIYPMNQQVLEEAGAKLSYFSPLENDVVPQCDSLWIPGGYPELHLDVLSNSDRTRTSILDHHRQNKPILAECGGMMYLCNSILNTAGEYGRTCGILNASCEMETRFQSVGLQAVNYGQGEIRGHSFHHSKIFPNLGSSVTPEIYATRQDGCQGEAVYKNGNSRLSYIHHYFASNSDASASLFLSPDCSFSKVNNT
jgi:cobyrinic acid a,c-diamide synthase